MLIYAVKRLSVALLVAMTVSLITFSMIYLSGDPAMALAGESASQSDIENIRRVYGYDQPIIVQYFSWLGNALTGNLGHSHYLKTEVSAVIFTRLPVTMTLGACALTFALTLSIPLGVVAAMRPNTLIDRIALTIAVIGQALPSFWFALMMIILFGVTLRWLPITGSDSWMNFIMPSLAAVQFGFMLGGSIVIETIFAINGLGQLAWESILRADLPMMQAIVLVLSCFYIVLTLLADLLNAFLDPRIRVS